MVNLADSRAFSRFPPAKRNRVPTTLQPASAPSPALATPRQVLAAVQDRIRFRHYSLRTERAYVHWTRRFITFHGRRNPRGMGAGEVTAFLGSLAVEGNVCAATQNQALAALLFLYKEVLGVELPWLDTVPKAKRGVHLPTVLTREEVTRVFEQMSGVHALMARLQYGTGMRLMECLRLRVKDVDLKRREIVIRQGKGGKDRVTMLPATLLEPLQRHDQPPRPLI
jgi:integrase